MDFHVGWQQDTPGVEMTDEEWENDSCLWF